MVLSSPTVKHHQGKLILVLAQIIMTPNCKAFCPESSVKCSRKCKRLRPSSSSESKFPWLKSTWRKSKTYSISPKMTSKSDRSRAKGSTCRTSPKNMSHLQPKPWNSSKEASLTGRWDKPTWMIPPQDLTWPSSSPSIKIISKMQVPSQGKSSWSIWQAVRKSVKLELKGNFWMKPNK